MPQHIAILKPEFIPLILSGTKTVESRLTYNNIAPWQKINPGQRIYFKQSAGPFRATAIVDYVDFYDDLNLTKLKKLYDQYNPAVCGSKEYWFTTKAKARYASFITLKDALPLTIAPPMKPSQGLAWFVIEDANIPLPFAVTLTAGAIKNGYLQLNSYLQYLPTECIGGNTIESPGSLLTLHLPNQRTVQSDISAKHHLRWRGWRHLYLEFGMQVGDIVIFEPLDPMTYRVHFQIHSKIKP